MVGLILDTLVQIACMGRGVPGRVVLVPPNETFRVKQSLDCSGKQ